MTQAPSGPMESGLESGATPLPDVVQDESERALAARFAPILMLDEREPFRPQAVGYRIFRQSGRSPSFPRDVSLNSNGDPQAAFAIEYAIWWDWDIEHLYELEHVWVYVDGGGRPVRVEASAHGEWRDMRLGEPGGAVLEDTHPVLYAEPGKHAMAAQPGDFERVREAVVRMCERLAGCGGVWVTPLFAGRLSAKTPLADRLVHTYLEKRRFVPSFAFNRRFPIGSEQLVPWEALEAVIPDRVGWWEKQLARMIPADQRRWLRIAHRGASAHAPENSAAAIRLAAQLGADMVEMDVRLSRDGVPVVIHDPFLDRATTGRGPVAAHTWKELKTLRLRDSRTGEVCDESLLTLADALDLCRAEQVGVYADVKEGAAAPAVVTAIQASGLAPYCIVGSARPDDVRAVRELAPELPAAWMVGLPPRDVAGLLAQLVEVGGTYLHLCWEGAGPRPDRYLTRADVDLVHAAGKGIICWHEERPEVIDGLRQLGVDGVCSDRPELLAPAHAGS
ncbi:MAG: hypothetical protein H0Z37_04765 [Firmicutes bacterium]|nr:hypothetical protein [Bacillota bacterium]